MLIVIMGTTGVGKDTLADEIIKQEHFSRIVRPTTRPKRPEEKHGERYDFLEKNGEPSYEQNKIICNRIFGDKGWEYGIYSSAILNINDEKEHIISLDRMTALSFYNEAMKNKISKHIYFVSVNESDPKEKALERIVGFRANGEEEYDDFLKCETERRLETDHEDVLNTMLLGAHYVTTSSKISKHIKNDTLEDLAYDIVDCARQHWSEMGEIKHDFDF